MNSNGSSMWRKMWDDRVTICNDARRIRYCAEQVLAVIKHDCPEKAFAGAMHTLACSGQQITLQQRHVLEGLYRSFVLLQPIPSTVLNDSRH